MTSKKHQWFNNPGRVATALYWDLRPAQQEGYNWYWTSSYLHGAIEVIVFKENNL